MAQVQLPRKSESFASIPNYELLEKLGESPQSVVYKAYHKSNPEKLLALKVFKATFSSEAQKKYFRQKLEHLKILYDPGVITPSTFEERWNLQFVTQPYFDGIPLNQWTQRKPVSLEKFFAISIELAALIEKVHKAGIMHGGIKPHNILIHPRTLGIRLIDFISPLDVRSVSHFIYDRSFVEGSLAYTSPEQTGRISHRVDFTTDLYSLGIVFYEMLTGRLPFFSIDPLELIHSHLAEEAPPAHELDPRIPPMVGKLISKLILKQPEKRYQGGSGLLADLLKCQEEYNRSGTIPEFTLGTFDRTQRVTFVSKMVGRDQEAAVILGEYDEAAKGRFRSLFISGLSGIGKTRLIQELQRPIVKHKGYFTSGKFDVYQKNIPYSSLIQALRNLVRTFLTESDERVAFWRKKLLEALDGKGRVITDVIPELSILIGPQTEVNPLPPIEARNRFHDVFGRFLSSLASEEHPLVLFIDDLQWCDVASFEFLTNIFSDHKEHPYLFLLGAYRYNEVDSSHPLTRLIQNVQEHHQPLREIRLEPLKIEHCHEMVSYILDSPLSQTATLSEFIYQLTEGNPLFVSESLSYLYNENLIFLDEGRQWQWNLDRIRESNMPSSVVALFSAKVQKLPGPTIELLEYCACMGNLFTPDDVSLVREMSLLDVFETLKPALSQQLLTENKDQLQFIHDRVQEATLSAIPQDRRQTIHWEIGNHFLSALPEGTDLEKVDHLFTIASHLNLATKGRSKELSKDLAYRFSDVNFHAGNKALDSLATEAANEYFLLSLDLLPEDCWEAQYSRTFKIYRKLAKTELMCGKYESSEKLLNQLLDNARSDLDKAEALAEQTTSLSSIGNFIKAIETANRGLAFFNKSIPEDRALAESRRDGLMKEINEKYTDVWSTILHMPFTTERKSKIELAFYSELIPDLYMSGMVPQLYLAAVQSTQHCLQGGMDESVIYSFSIMGLYLGEREEFELAFRYEDLARNLSEKYPNTFGATRGMNGVVWCNIHSRSHPAEIIKYCLKSIQSGKNCGDLYNAGLSYGPLMWNHQVCGTSLHEIEACAEECLQFSLKYHLSFSVGLAEAMRAGWIAPMKKDYVPVPMDEKIANWEKANHIASIGSYFVHMALSAYYFKEYEEADRHLQEVKRYLRGLTDNVLKRQYHVFLVLNALRLHEAGKAFQDRKVLLDTIEPLQKKVETWAQYGPLLKPYLALLYAEKERILGDPRAAKGHYLDAIGIARKERYLFLEGYINECLGDLLEKEDCPTCEVFYAEALRLYGRCHAERKELLLSEKVPEAFWESVPPSRAPAPEPTEGAPVPQSSFVLPSLDVDYLMKSSLAISAEIDISALLKKIMNVVLEASGAQSGYLIIEEGGDLMVRAESKVSEKGSVSTAAYRLKDASGIAKAIVRYVHRTKQPVLLHNACEEGDFKDNLEVQSMQLRSVLCLPLIEKSRMIGLLYLENRLSNSVFTPGKTEVTRLLTSQAAISLENARLVEEMKKVEEQITKSLREKDVLLKEIHHRVKNNLQVISSLLSSQSRLIRDPSALELFKESQSRVKSIALVHERLYQSADLAMIDFSKYVRALATDLFRSYGVDPNRIALRMDFHDVSVSINAAVSLGLIVNELLSNSLKHAFPGGRSGEIRIGMRLDRDLILVVEDNGKGIPSDFDIRRSPTLGLQLVMTLVEQLKARIELDRSRGTRFTIVVGDLGELA